MDEVFGTIERITFQSEESGFTVAQLKTSKVKDPVCIVGTLPMAQPGETVRCQGHWKRHPSHGLQFEVTDYSLEQPADIQGIQKYLGSGLIKGIGPIYAKKIVEKFGIQTLQIIDTEPKRLKEVEGLGPKRVQLIATCWSEQRTIRDVMIFLQTHGVTPGFAQKIYKKYRERSIQVVSENPYVLARELHGVGFKSADKIAAKLGIARDSLYRFEAGIEYTLRGLSEEGHVCFPKTKLMEETATLLEIESSVLDAALDSLKKDERIEIFPILHEGDFVPFVWLMPLFVAETGIARELKRVLAHPCSMRSIDTTRALPWVQERLSITLADNQKKAVAEALTSKLMIITGGPGTGKSTITKAILAISSQLTSKIALAAPTGRAAKRMSEITGYKALTIHALLEVDFKRGGFKRGKQNPLDLDLLIVDEASMIDTHLMYSLLRAVPPHARVLFVGDIHQLPSVGPGNVLKDMIQSKKMTVITLTEIFRQAAGSRIITNAHKINQGHFPDLEPHPESDFFFIEAEDPEELAQQIVACVAERLPRKYGFHPFDDIQVLAPMKKGAIGTEMLNTLLQEKLNPHAHGLVRFGQKLASGDKVMQIRNNYEKHVYNGDIGRIDSLDVEDQTLQIRFDGRLVLYDFSDLDEIVLAYAVSVHKYQGSECPCVVIPIHTAHFMLLHRNLLYTAVTRGKRLVLLVGTRKAVALATHNNLTQERHTGLPQALIDF